MRPLDSKKIVVATHNKGKLAEIRELLAPYGMEATSVGELGLPEPAETGETFEENAYTKAFAAASATGLPALSDDSGLVVDALGGRPGVHTADWAEKPDGSGRDFMMAMQLVEDELQKIGAKSPESRTGRFVAVLCMAWPDGHAEYFRGEVDGHAGVAAARHARLRLRSGVQAGRLRSHLRRDGIGRKARLGGRPRRSRPVAPRPRIRAVRHRHAGAEMSADTSPGFGVYVHWPFCAAKCPYCDFNSHVRHQPVDQERFASAFAREMATMRARTGPREVTSIFLGGGTPSLMKPETVGAVLDAVAQNWSVPDGIEVTLEANPSSVEAERFTGYRAAGVNRVSLGVQALNDPDLRFLGRLHNVEQALHAIELARDTFPRLSFDLIYARPGQTPEAWAAELKQAIGHAADHLSLYQLTIEEGTPFHALAASGKLVVPDPDTAAELYRVTQEVTADAGLPAYEISNHARPGAESRHNLVYWRYGEYVGVGPGAHGRFIESGRRVVTFTEKTPERWANLVEAKGHGVIGGETLTRVEEADEFLLMGLRLTEGIDLARYEQLAGRPLPSIRISNLQDEHLVEPLGNSRLRATPAGMIVLDAVVADLAA